MNYGYLIQLSWRVAVFVSVLLVSAVTHAAGLLQPSDGSLPPLALKDHKVDVVIEDGYAITRVEQVFFNHHQRDLEAHYSFPLPQHGSLAEFTLWIDGQPVTGEVLERERAKQVYREEKAAGRDAGITEKDSYKSFETKVAPVRAGQETRIRLVYLQPAHLDTGIGRYVYPLEEGGVDEEKLAFWTANEQVTGRFSFDLLIRSAYPVAAVRMPNQPQSLVRQTADGDWHVSLSGGPSATAVEDDVNAPLESQPLPSATNTQTGSGVFTLDRDLVVYWRHQAGLPGSVDLVAHKPQGQKRGTFMLVVTPGDDLQPIREGRDWVFVLDVSGSMRGKYATLADGVQRALGKMRPEDRFRIVLFNNKSRELTSGFVNASAEAVHQYSQAVAAVSPEQGTNMYAGVKLGLKTLQADRTSALVLVTDGVANLGETRQRQFVDLIRTKDIRLFTFVMGNSANRPLLEAMTRASNGFAVSVSNSDDILGRILAATTKVTHQALHGAKLEISGVKTADLTPQRIGSIYRGQQLVVFGHYWGHGVAEVKLSGRISGRPKSYQTRFAFPSSAEENPEIERLWAYSTIEAATRVMNDFGEKPDLKQAVIDLGVEYGLVTDFTAMVVVQEEVFAQRGIERRNKKRLLVERAAQQQRAGRPAASRRVDTKQPMYSSSRPDYSGSGSLDAWSLLLLLPLAWLVWLKRRGLAV